MNEENKDALPLEQQEEQKPKQEPYVPASRKKRVAAWIGVILMVLLVFLYTYSIATGAILNW